MKNEKSHYFYVLLCQDGSFHGGCTVEPECRLIEHDSGTGAKYTRLVKRRSAKMIHIEKFETRNTVTKAEAAFKKLTRKQKEQYLKTSY